MIYVMSGNLEVIIDGRCEKIGEGGISLAFPYQSHEYHTDEEYLGPVILGEGLVVGEQGPYGLYIKVVDGVTADFDVDQSYWSLYVGQEPAMQGADTTPIADGDSFRLVYTIG